MATHGVEYTKRPTTGPGSWQAVDKGIHMQGKRQRGVKFDEFFKGMHVQRRSSSATRTPPTGFGTRHVSSTPQSPIPLPARPPTHPLSAVLLFYVNEEHHGLNNWEK